MAAVVCGSGWLVTHVLVPRINFGDKSTKFHELFWGSSAPKGELAEVAQNCMASSLKAMETFRQAKIQLWDDCLCGIDLSVLGLKEPSGESCKPAWFCCLCSRC